MAGFPSSTTVADLKKHMKEAGDIIAADIRDGTGYIEYENNEDFRYAVKKLDDTDLETEAVYISHNLSLSYFTTCLQLTIVQIVIDAYIISYIS